MLLSIGIDTVTVSDVERFLGRPNYVNTIFTDEENRLAQEYNDTLDFYARRFAGKQAVKKALDHFVDVSNFDYHDVEILDTAEGIMYVRMAKNLKAALEDKNVGDFLISVTSEGDLATAIVMAQSI